ncbi:hypothetical protein IE980_25465 [Klebsiella pneumoniae]|uniref:Uncharacterized protein n=1 Tax=Klebsiella pneumoniae TaxID=573 RepID=A0A927E461_KLEPN|nr:hypothetical protein [Klebsiella pneumoniae]
MLAMPNAAGSRPLGDLLPLQPRPARLSPALPAVHSPAAASRHLSRPLPAKAASPGIGWWRSMTIARR